MINCQSMIETSHHSHWESQGSIRHLAWSECGDFVASGDTDRCVSVYTQNRWNKSRCNILGWITPLQSCSWLSSPRRRRRACVLRALGLLLTDGALTVGRGKTFWCVDRGFFYGFFYGFLQNKYQSLKKFRKFFWTDVFFAKKTLFCWM